MLFLLCAHFHNVAHSVYVDWPTWWFAHGKLKTKDGCSRMCKSWHTLRVHSCDGFYVCFAIVCRASNIAAKPSAQLLLILPARLVAIFCKCVFHSEMLMEHWSCFLPHAGQNQKTQPHVQQLHEGQFDLEHHVRIVRRAGWHLTAISSSLSTKESVSGCSCEE